MITPSPEVSTDRTLQHVSAPAASGATVAQVVPPKVAAAGVPEVPGYAVGGEIARGGMGRVEFSSPSRPPSLSLSAFGDSGRG